MNAPMSNERLEQIQARAAAATPGPWEAWDTGDPPAEDEAQSWIVTPGSLHLATLYAGDPSANATFAAHAREDIPALLEEIDRLHEEVRGQRYVAEMLARVAEAAHRREDRVRDCLDKIRLDKTPMVTDEMVEHAAEALYDQRYGYGWDEDAWENEKDKSRELAREVLEAALGGGES